MTTAGPMATTEAGFVRGLAERRPPDALVRILTFLGALAIWQLLSMLLPRILFASPGKTAEAMDRMLRTGALVDAWRESFGVLVVALAISAGSGVGLGILLGRFRLADRFFEPLLTGLFMTPKIVLIPIISLWLGYQEAPKIVVVFLFSFFEIFFTVRNGVRTIDAQFVEVAQAYCVPEFVMLRRVILPAATPFVVAGLRLGLLHGMVGIVLAGFFLENDGIGGLINIEAESFRVAGLFAALITVAAVGVAMNYSLRWIEARVAPWQTQAFA
jgi:ABC-type nitrate/sulfonate/bicarbonate transport system permease component